ncbi:MAG: hypothetical protein ACI97A_002769 [Planctomycetota bacterium]|jgi:hypothetical protein
MSTSIKLFATLAAVIFLAACESSSNGRTNSNTGPRPDRSLQNNTDPSNPELDSEAVHNQIRDCRVLLYDPRTAATIILVNKKHSWRKDERSQLNITNGVRNRTYKLLTDQQIDALLETFKQRGADGIRAKYTDRHAALLSHRSKKGDSFKGIIIIENNGRRSSYIARTPRGEPSAIQKYAIFSQMRQAVFVYDRVGLSEQVGSSATGSAPLDQLAVPRDNSNRR